MTLSRVVLVLGLAVFPRLAMAEIQHQPIACVVADQFPRLEATYAPPEALGRARVVFRPKGGKHWYSVPMVPEDGKLAGVLPRPKKSLASLDYYVEATDTGMATTRTPDQTARVAEGPGACSQLPTASTVASAKVTLQVPAGAPSVPPGFNAAGIVASTSGAAAGAAAGAGAAGTATVGAAGGGGVGAGVLIAAGVVAAGGAAVAATAGGGGNGDGDGPGPTPSPSPSAGPGPTPSPSPSGAPPPNPGGSPTLGLSVSTQLNDRFPVTLQFQGQSITSPGDVTWLEVPMPAAGNYQFTVTPSRSGEVNIGLRDNTPQGGVGVQPSSIAPTAPVTRTTGNCGRTVQASGPFTVTFVLAAGQSCGSTQ